MIKDNIVIADFDVSANENYIGEYWKITDEINENKEDGKIASSKWKYNIPLATKAIKMLDLCRRIQQQTKNMQNRIILIYNNYRRLINRISRRII